LQDRKFFSDSKTVILVAFSFEYLWLEVYWVCLFSLWVHESVGKWRIEQ